MAGRAARHQCPASDCCAIARLEDGNPGDVKPVGEGVSEMRVNYGPGYRVYFIHQGKLIVVLLCGGGKSTQSADIARAKQMAKEQ